MRRPRSRLRHQPARRRDSSILATRSARRATVGLERLESRTLLAVSAQLVGGTLSIQCSAAKDLATLTAFDTSYTVAGTGMETKTFLKSAVQSIAVSDTGAGHASQSLLIGGSSPVSQPLSVTGIESTVLNTDMAIASGKGDVSFGGPVTLGKGQSIDISNAVGRVVFGSTLNGAALLKIDAPNREILFKGKVGNTTPLARLSVPAAGAFNALSSIAVDGLGKSFLSGIAIGRDVKQVILEAAGSSVKGFGVGISIEASSVGTDFVRSLKNFKLSGNGIGLDFTYGSGQTVATAGFHNWRVAANTIADNLLHGIRLSADAAGKSAATTVMIDQNAILRNKRDGIRVDGTPAGVTLQNNMLADNGTSNADAAIRITDGLGLKATTVAVTNNAIGWSSSTTTSPATGILARNMPGLSIGGNTVNGYGTGISLTGDFTRSGGLNVLAGNTVTRASQTGIVLDSATHVIAMNNTINGGFGGLGAFGTCTGSVVTGGSISGLFGVDLTNAAGITIQNAKVSGSYIGIRVAGDSPGTVLTSPTITNATIGIALDSGRGLTLRSPVVSKSLSGTGPFGLPVIGTAFVAQGDCTGSSVVGGSFNGAYGIRLAGATGLSMTKGVTGLTVPDCTTAGIHITGICTKTSIADALVSGSKGDGIVLEAAQGVTLQGMTSKMNAGQGVKASGDCTNTRLLKGVVTQNTKGVSLTGAKNLLVGDGTIVRFNTAVGLAVSGACVGTSVNACDVSSNGTGVTLDAAQGVLVADNTIIGNKANGVSAKGACAASVLAANTIQSAAGNGVVLSSATGLQINDGAIGGHDLSGLYAEGNCAGTSISGVPISNNSKYGVVLNAAKGLTLTGTTVTLSGVHGLQASGDCAGTTLTGTAFTGSKLSGAALSAAKNLKISGATFDTNAVHGLVADGDCAGTSLTASSFKGNKQVGVVLNAAKGISLSGCEMATNSTHGLQALAGCTGSTITGSKLTGNTLSGVVLSAAQGLTVNAGNTIQGNGANGLQANDLCTGTKVGGNTISTNGNAGLFLVAAKGLTVVNNTVTNNVKFGLNASGLSTGTTVLGNTITGSEKNFVVTATGGTFQKA